VASPVKQRFSAETVVVIISLLPACDGRSGDISTPKVAKADARIRNQRMRVDDSGTFLLSSPDLVARPRRVLWRIELHLGFQPLLSFSSASANGSS